MITSGIPVSTASRVLVSTNAFTREVSASVFSPWSEKKSIDYETIINRWHNGHTPLSLKIHPLWHYSRNVVTSGWTEDDPWYDGIVEEHCRTRKELMNPTIFFKNALVMIPNMIRVYQDVNSFLDYGSVEPYLTSEYILKEK